MALPITIPSDYKGEISITTNKYTKKDLELYIDDYELEIIEDLLGCELAELFIADLDVDNMPQEPRFTAIYDKFCIDLDCGDWSIKWNDLNYFYSTNQNVRSIGMKEMIKRFVYVYFTREDKQKQTVSGGSVNESTAAREASNPERNIVRQYNKAVDTHRAIQYYICNNEDGFEYDEFGGIRKDFLGIL